MKNLDKIKYVDLVFENCEVARLKPSMFNGLMVRGITEGFMINCFQYKEGEIYRGIECNHFEMRINRSGLDLKYSEDSTDILCRRLIRYRDITHVDLFFEDDTNKYITVPWGLEGEEFTNTRQFNHLLSKEEMKIIIK